MPLASHLYVFEVVGAPKLMRSIVGNTRNVAASALHDEIALMMRASEEQSGLHTRCVAVWLHGAYLKDALEEQLDKQLVPRVSVTAKRHGAQQ